MSFLLRTRKKLVNYNSDILNFFRTRHKYVTTYTQEKETNTFIHHIWYQLVPVTTSNTLHVHSALKFEKSAKKLVKKGRDNPLFLTKAKINGKSIQFSTCSAAPYCHIMKVQHSKLFCEIEYKNCSRKYKIIFISHLSTKVHFHFIITKMSILVRQKLRILKEENLKLKENFKNFLKKYEENKKFITKIKIQEFIEEQDTMIDNINEHIDDVIAKSDEENGSRPSKRIRKEKSAEETYYFENFITNPGLQHLAENIFVNLNYQELKTCRLINKSSRTMLDNPMFWLKKLIRRGLSKQNQTDWIKAIHLTRDTNFKTNILGYLKSSFQNELAHKLQSHNNEADFNPDYNQAEVSDVIDGMTPIHLAAWYGETEIVRFLAPITHNPIVPNENGETPIHFAISSYQQFAPRKNVNPVDTLRILTQFTNNPNAPNNYGETPIFLAAQNEDADSVRFLAPLTDNPNFPNKDGITPMDVTNTKIKRILKSFL